MLWGFILKIKMEISKKKTKKKKVITIILMSIAVVILLGFLAYNFLLNPAIEEMQKKYFELGIISLATQQTQNSEIYIVNENLQIQKPIKINDLCRNIK